MTDSRRDFGYPVSEAKSNSKFEAVPWAPSGSLVLPFQAVSQKKADDASVSGKLVFHVIGDTGGINGTDVQELVAEAMEAQFTKGDDSANPAFCYHVGDVVYYSGMSRHYPEQFYEPYKYYPAPIFAIPGNHDGDTHVRPGDEPDDEASLTGFRLNFCDPHRHHYDAYRDTMTQPYVYWSLDAPFAYIIGLYGNIDGMLDGTGTAQQEQWLTSQLSTAPKDKFVVVAVHQPPYSLDTSHGGYPHIINALDRAVAASQRDIDMVLSGHVHNYQRFTRTDGTGNDRPYVVIGNGGYARTVQSLHKLQKDPATDAYPSVPFATLDPDNPNVVLNAYDTMNVGFARVTVTADSIAAEYFSVDMATGATTAGDKFTVTKHMGSRSVA